jgi:RNA polymerase sigma-70 factor, ECF subfamily
MAKVQQGDQAAFAQLVHRHVDALYSYALRLSRTPANAEDLVQESWLSAWSNASSFDPAKAKLTTWLHRILHNRFIDGVRKKTEVLDSEAIDAALVDGSLSESVVLEERLSALNRMINQLPGEQRAALVLRHFQGFGNEDISHILGVSVRAVESLLARARRTLRNQEHQTQAADANTESTHDGNNLHE